MSPNFANKDSIKDIGLSINFKILKWTISCLQDLILSYSRQITKLVFKDLALEKDGAFIPFFELPFKLLDEFGFLDHVSHLARHTLFTCIQSQSQFFPINNNNSNSNNLSGRNTC